MVIEDEVFAFSGNHLAAHSVSTVARDPSHRKLPRQSSLLWFTAGVYCSPHFLSPPVAAYVRSELQAPQDTLFNLFSPAHVVPWPPTPTPVEHWSGTGAAADDCRARARRGQNFQHHHHPGG